MNESMNDKGVCRSAPATPGLLYMPIERDAIEWKCNKAGDYTKGGRSWAT